MANFLYCFLYSYCSFTLYRDSLKSDNLKKKKQRPERMQRGLRVITSQGAIEKNSILLPQY